MNGNDPLIREPDGPRERLRVLHLLSGDLWAGAEVGSYHLLAALAERDDVEVSAVLLNPGPLAEALSQAGVDYEVWPEAEESLPDLIRRFRSRAREASLVHAHRYKENLIAACSGRPWVSTQHGMPEPFAGWAGLRSALRRCLDGTAKRFSAHGIVAVSRAMEVELRGRFGSKVHCVRNGIADPTESISPVAWEARKRCCGVLARLVPVKGIELAIEAMLHTEGVELEIVGDGPRRVQLETRAQALGLSDRIEFVGFDPKPLRRLANWRGLLVTSFHEGLPISVLEAMALGTPILSADLPGVCEAIGEDGGTVIPDRLPETWGRQLQRIVDDSVAGSRASQAARARFEVTFLADESAARMVDLYRGVVVR